MHKRKKVKVIQEILSRLYPDPPIPLKHSSDYTLLIAVLLSAQCTDARVNLVTPHLFSLADTPEKMITLTIDEITAIIKTCGLAPTKAKAIYHLSHMLIDQFGGEVPNSFEALKSLPGVGHKTASVVMAQAFEQAAFPVDTHIHRCAKRWGLSSGKTVEQTEKDLKSLFPKECWRKLHLQIIYFAREYCPAKKHDPRQCPICTALLEEEQDIRDADFIKERINKGEKTISHRKLKKELGL